MDIVNPWKECMEEANEVSKCISQLQNQMEMLAANIPSQPDFSMMSADEIATAKLAQYCINKAKKKPSSVFHMVAPPTIAQLPDLYSKMVSKTSKFVSKMPAHLFTSYEGSVLEPHGSKVRRELVDPPPAEDDQDQQYLTDIFDSLAEQYEKNNEMEDLIYKLETLNMYPHVLGTNSLDLTSTAIRLLTEALDYTVERQTELCNRLTVFPSQDDGDQSLHVKADDQANILNAFARIVMFVNSLKDLIIDTEKVPTLSAELEEILPRLTLSGDSMSQLDIQFNGIEDARSVLATMTQLRSAFKS